MNGYDESNYQGDINNAVVPGDFDIIKATEGIGWTDPDCDPNFQQAKAAGKKLGFYHFARGNDPIAEAKWFLSQTLGYFGQGVPVLDLEVDPKTPEYAKAFLDYVYAQTQVRGWLYASQSVFNSGDWSSVWPDYAAWVASYGANSPQTGYGDPNAPVTINGNWTIVAVQYTSQGRLPGWGGDLDLDIAYITPEQWDKYAIGDRNAPAPTPAPQPAPVVEPTPAPVVTPVPVTHVPTPTQSVPVVAKPTPVTAPKDAAIVRFIRLVLQFLLGIPYNTKKQG